MRLLLVGNYGVGNLGDEALREYFLRRFTDVQWQVLSAQPRAGELPRLPAGVRSFLAFTWISTMRALWASDGMVFGGGTLFTDVESPRACVIWWIHAAAARLLGKPIVYAFQGVGPFTRPWAERLARQALGWGRAIVVRDEASLKRVRSWNLNTEVVQSFDPVILIIRPKNDDRSNKLLSVIPRHNSGPALLRRAEALVAQQGFEQIRVVLMQPDDVGEKKMAEAIAALSDLPVEVRSVSTLDQLERALVRSALVLTERYHGGIAALALGIPTEIVSQGEGDKLSALRDLIPRFQDAAGYAELREQALQGERAILSALGLSSGKDGQTRSS